MTCVGQTRYAFKAYLRQCLKSLICYCQIQNPPVLQTSSCALFAFLPCCFFSFPLVIVSLDCKPAFILFSDLHSQFLMHTFSQLILTYLQVSVLMQVFYVSVCQPSSLYLFLYFYPSIHSFVQIVIQLCIYPSVYPSIHPSNLCSSIRSCKHPTRFKPLQWQFPMISHKISVFVTL